MMKEKDDSQTTSPVKPGEFTGVTPEFGRCTDCTRLYGLRRGTLYNLLNNGKIKGVLLRVKGQKSGVRLFDLNSIRNYIRSQMEAAEMQAAKKEVAKKEVAEKEVAG